MKAAADDADPDGDGLPNVLEYVLGFSPVEPQPGEPLTVRVTSHEDGLGLVLEFARQGDVTVGSALEVEEGDLLTPWTAIASKTGAAAWTGSATVEETGGADGFVVVRVAPSPPVPSTDGESGRRFWRLRAKTE